MENTVIILSGPTASGKTAAAIEVAKHFNSKIISADSRQCFRELNIGVARPSEEELRAVKHFFIASHSVKEKLTANDFENFALTKVNELFETNPVVVMVGGTGLYIKAFCEGLDPIPAVDDSLRANLSWQYNQNGLKWLQDQVKSRDPEFWKVAEQQNPQRLLRALEVLEGTGKSILEFRKGIKLQRPFRIVKTAIDIPGEKLHENIRLRVHRMFESGLVEEVRSVLPYRHLNALQTVGYKELFEYFDQKISLDEAGEKIATNTRQYAKRQLTWFRKDKEIKWLPAEAILPQLKILL